MATPSLIHAALPAESELQSFASAAAQLLIDRQARIQGVRTVKRRPGIGIQHFDHRDYAPGDEVRHIDWRQTARRRQPIVRRFESESVSDWTIVLDASSSMAVNGAAKWRAAMRMAAAMSYALLQLGHRVSVLVFGGRLLSRCPLGRGQPHYAMIASLLAKLQPSPKGERSDLSVCVRHLHGAASVFVISDFLADDEMRRDLAGILQRCTALHLMQIADREETRLSSAEAVDLEDVETAERMAWQPSVRADAAAALERDVMTGRLRSFCRRSSVAFSEWDITQPWQQVLLQHLIRARFNC